MRTSQELLEYVDRIIHIGVDKMEAGSQFALIDLQSASGKEGGNCEKMPVSLEANADEPEGPAFNTL